MTACIYGVVYVFVLLIPVLALLSIEIHDWFQFRPRKTARRARPSKERTQTYAVLEAQYLVAPLQAIRDAEALLGITKSHEYMELSSPSSRLLYFEELLEKVQRLHSSPLHGNLHYILPGRR